MANRRAIGAAILVVLVLIVGGLAYSAFKTPAAASGPITAIPLAPTAAGATGAGAAAQSPSTSTPQATTAAADGAGSATAAATTASSGTTASLSGEVVLQIAQDQSKARFIVDEVLNGKPNTVVGTTDQVAGEIAVDPTDPSRSRVGTIQVEARTLSTDSGMRNRTIANRILQTNQYEFITFVPTRLASLPHQAAVGQSYTFQVVGNLTIHGTTKEVTFDVTARAPSATRLEGTATTTINYSDYGIHIPQVPQVASVANQVRLELDFVAVPK